MRRVFLSGNVLGGYQGVVNQLTDQQLLRDYAANHSEAAFATLVRRHVDLVYSTALRLVVDRQLAEDVAQAVFLAVARDAEKLQACEVLSAWLHRTARNQASMIVRGEVRRRTREKEAVTMNPDASETDDAVWEQLAPHLDDALTQLAPADRDALLLRFFERKTAREIGERLGLSEAATQKRLTRALDRLREVFSERGVTVTSAALAGIISTQAVQAAPAALAATIAAATFTAMATTTTTFSTLSLFQVMASTQIKTALVSVVTVGLVTTVVLQHQGNQKLRAELSAHTAQIAQAKRAGEVPKTNEAANEELVRLRAQQSELLRLRGEVGLLRQQVKQQTVAPPAAAEPKAVAALPPGFIPAENWSNVGTATPQHAFQSFLATLKSGDSARIEAMAHWDIRWREQVTDEDIALVEKSKQDYLDMLKRASQKISAFNLAPVGDDVTERTRVFFETQTTAGEKVGSNFEMIQENGQWKPVMSMRWHDPNDPNSFVTTPVFGPQIDLEP